MLYFLISYEGVRDSETVCDAVDALGEQVIECFDASHVDGSEVVAVAVEAEAKDEAKWKKAIQNATWSVNGGLSADVRTLNEDQYDEFC